MEIEMNGMTFTGIEAVAVRELKRLKIAKVMDDDIPDSFTDLWYKAIHECDMYEELAPYGEYEEYMRGAKYKLDKGTYWSAKSWADRWHKLVTE